ncbi:diguanylate cyclase [Collimonas sp. H4R21]|uniref:Diguanylate cyclase n=1 Tax=Collimonas rhizosphaerae TaxID=3126357 RepID=A0ABU9Q1R8_9BURK
MPAIALNHYNLRAPRALLLQLKEFYCEVIGLEAGARPPFDSFGFWLYAGDQAVLHLSEARAGDIRHTDIATTFDHVAFSCVDPEEMEACLQAHALPYQVAFVPSAQQKQIFLRDPAGNGVELNFVHIS